MAELSLMDRSKERIRSCMVSGRDATDNVAFSIRVAEITASVAAVNP